MQIKNEVLNNDNFHTQLKEGRTDFSSVYFKDVDFREITFGDGDFSFFDTIFGDGDIDFRGSIFGNGDIDFRNAKFGDGDIDFRGSIFGKGGIYFNFTEFGDGDFNFSESTFRKNFIVFIGVTFGDGNVTFSRSTFGNAIISFDNIRFGDGNVSFFQTNFGNSKVHFSDTIFGDGDIDFFKTKFGNGNVNFEKLTFAGCHVGFDRAEFGDGNVTFSKIHFGNSKLNFTNTKFGDGNVTFEVLMFGDGEVDFTNTKFGDGDIDFRTIYFGNSDVYFKNTKFGDGPLNFQDIAGKLKFIEVNFKKETIFRNNVMVFWDFSESYILNAVFINNLFASTSNRIILNNEKNRDYKDMETLYRQLKISYTNRLSYELASKAYFSELEMKRKNLEVQLKNGNRKILPEYLIHLIYRYFGGYTINYITPLVWLLINLLIIFPLINILLSNRYSPLNSSSSLVEFISNIKAKEWESLIEQSIPIISIDKTELLDVSKFVLFPEIIINIILITFFILGLRRSFK